MYLFCVPNKKIICQGCLIIFILIGFVSNTAFSQGFLDGLKHFLVGGSGTGTTRAPNRSSTAPLTDGATVEAEVNAINTRRVNQWRSIMDAEDEIDKLRQELIPIARGMQRPCPEGTIQTQNDQHFCVKRQQHTAQHGGGVFYTRTRISQRLADLYNTSRQKYFEIGGRLRLKRAELERLQSDLDGMEDRITGAVPPEDRRVRERQDATIETLRLRVKLSDLDDSLGNIDEVLDQVERIYDNTVLGAYMQDKIGQLLNSQVICTARKRCAVGDPRKIPPSQIRDELFPSTQTRESYYNHRRLRRIRGRGNAD